MKAIALAAALAVISSAAVAEGLDWSVTLGAERSTESEVNTLYGSFGISNITLGAALEDTAANNGQFNISKYELDLNQPIWGGVSLYMENDFGDDFKHTDTVIGAKITF